MAGVPLFGSFFPDLNETAMYHENDPKLRFSQLKAAPCIIRKTVLEFDVARDRPWVYPEAAALEEQINEMLLLGLATVLPKWLNRLVTETGSK